MKENGVDLAKYILPLLKQIFISVEKNRRRTDFAIDNLKKTLYSYESGDIKMHTYIVRDASRGAK
jgi:hypothetical protein